MANETTKSLMIRGDRLLLALDVLGFFAHCAGQTKRIIQQFVEPDATVNPRRCSFARARRILERPVYAGILLAIEHTSSDAVRMLLYGVTPRAALARIHINSDALIPSTICFDGGDDTAEHPRVRRKRALKPLLAFFRAIASGELTEADFQEVK